MENTLTGQREQERFTISASPLPQVLEHQLSSRPAASCCAGMERAWVSDYLGLFSLPLLHNLRQEAAAFFWPAVHPLVLELQESSVPDSEGSATPRQSRGTTPPSCSPCGIGGKGTGSPASTGSFLKSWAAPW